jgi:hypothetical protein
MKTFPLTYGFIPVILALLWAIPAVILNEFDLGWATIELCVLAGTYVAYAHPGLFSFVPRRDREITCSAMA